MDAIVPVSTSVVRVWEAARKRVEALSTRVAIALLLVGIAAFSLGLRSLHLLDSDRYFILSPDSHFFHWVSRGIMAGGLPGGADSLSGLHRGLAQPLVWVAEATGAVFGLSDADALNLASVVVPLALGVVTLLVVYYGASRLLGRQAAFFATASFTLMTPAIFFAAAGYLDRDGLSMLLLLVGGLAFLFSRGWGLSIRGHNVGWLLGAVVVLLVEALLYLEWKYAGPALLLGMLLSYAVVQFLFRYSDNLRTEADSWRRIRSAARDAQWGTFAVVGVGNLILAGAKPHVFTQAFEQSSLLLQLSGASTIAEQHGLAFGDLPGNFQFLLIPMAVGVYAAVKSRHEPAVFFACWLFAFLALSLFASRIALYATPAACMLSGIGLAFIWNRIKFLEAPNAGKYAVVVVLLLASLFSIWVASGLGSSPLVAANEEWQDALVYLSEETPPDAVVMAEWSYGYWILDLAERKPFVDNGYYGHSVERDRDVALTLSSSDPNDAAQIMRKHGTDFLVMSQVEQDFVGVIMLRAYPEGSWQFFPVDSLYARTMSGEFEGGDGLEVVYRNSGVVVLGLIPDAVT